MKTDVMKESYTVVVVTKDPEQFLKYRNVTNMEALFNFLIRKKLTPTHANLYNKSGVYLKRVYPAQ